MYNYKNLFGPQNAVYAGKDDQGSWIEPFDRWIGAALIPKEMPALDLVGFSGCAGINKPDGR